MQPQIRFWALFFATGVIWLLDMKFKKIHKSKAYLLFSHSEKILKNENPSFLPILAPQIIPVKRFLI